MGAVLPTPEDLTVLGSGWFRTTWRVDTPSEALVLKTLRLEREFLREYYELHRRDAVAMERLTASPFVVDVYGVCGNSALNELADFPVPGVQSLEVFNRRLRGHDEDAVYVLKLKMAASISTGLADVHGIDDDERVTLVHYDLNPRNVALFHGGRPKLNDYNIAEFLHYNTETNETCGFPSRLHEPWWRAPEEMETDKNTTVIVNEKVDIYALGNLIFHTLTTHSPRGKMIPSRVDEVREQVRKGIRPILPERYRIASHPAAVAMRKAMDMCYEFNPTKRGTAQEVADLLLQALLNVTEHAAAGNTEADFNEVESNNSNEGEDSEDEQGVVVEAKG